MEKQEKSPENLENRKNITAYERRKFILLAIWVAVLAILALAINIGMPKLHSKQTFDAVDLPSSIVGAGEPRTVIDGGKRVCLTYGPYITLYQGEYDIRVYYETDTDENTVDVFSLDVDGILYYGKLEKDKNIHEFKLKLEEKTPRVEIRTGYSGVGSLSVEKIEVLMIREDIERAQSAANFLLIGLLFASVGYLLPKVKACNVVKMTWKRRLKNSVPLALLLSFTVCVAGPVSLYLTNTDEFWFSIWQMLPILLAAFATISVFTITVLTLCRGQIYIYTTSLVFGITVCLYVEGNFLMQDYGLLDGKTIDWNAYEDWASVDTLVWISFLILFLILTFYLGIKIIDIARIGSTLLICVQMVAILIILPTAKDISKDSEYILTTENYTTVSNKENIIVFLLDAFDSSYMDDLLTAHPEYEVTFENFVWYRDAATAAAPTHVAMPIIYTGYRYTDPISFDSYIDKAFEYTPLFKELKKANYDVTIYGSSRYVSRNQENYITNIFNEKPKVSSYSKLLYDIMKLTGFRYMPHILKEKFIIYSDEFSKLKESTSNDFTSYSGMSSESYTMLQTPLQFEDDKNAFRFYHLMGAHPPFSLDENANIVPSSNTTLEGQIRGCFLIISEYINQLKNESVYDNSTIIIMADHGNIEAQQNPLFMIKTKNNRGAFRISTAPISYTDLLPTFLEIIGVDGSEYGRSIFEIGENEKRERYFYRDNGEESRRLVELMTTDVAWNYDAWIETGKVYYGDADPEKRQKYVFGTELSFLEEATGNQYAVEGLGRISDSYTITTKEYSILDIPLAHKPKKDLTASITVTNVIGKKNRLIIYANDIVVCDVENANGTIEFIIPHDLVENDLVLRLEYPDAIDVGYMSAFNIVQLIIDD